MLEVAYEIFCELLRAERPLLIFGHGVKLACAEQEARELAELLDFPVCPTWGALDVFPDCVGGFGTHGTRAANFAVQNADYILSVGSRLDTKATGSPAKGFAPKAKLTMVDVDQAELDKMARIGRPLHHSINADAKDFLSELNAWAREARSLRESIEAMSAGPRIDVSRPMLSAWHAKIAEWKVKYPAVDPAYNVGDGVNPYKFIDELSDLLRADDVIVSDTGCALGWMMQAYRFKGERFIHAFNQTPMGSGLPAAVGAAFATGGRVILVSGDGGLSVNITELATVARHSLPIKILLFNNRGHAMCRQTQRTWLGGTYPSTSYEGGLATPDFKSIAWSYGITVHDNIGTMLREEGPGLLNLDISLDYQIVPQVRFGRELHDADPLLPREELEEVMR